MRKARKQPTRVAKFARCTLFIPRATDFTCVGEPVVATLAARAVGIGHALVREQIAYVYAGHGREDGEQTHKGG